MPVRHSGFGHSFVIRVSSFGFPPLPPPAVVLAPLRTTAETSSILYPFSHSPPPVARFGARPCNALLSKPCEIRRHLPSLFPAKPRLFKMRCTPVHQIVQLASLIMEDFPCTTPPLRTTHDEP